MIAMCFLAFITMFNSEIESAIKNNEQNVISVKEGQIIHLSAEELQNNKIVLENIVECGGMIIRLQNGSTIVYHRYFSDSINDVINKISKYVASKHDIKNIQILGGNVDNRCRPCDDTELYFQGKKISGKEFFDIFHKDQKKYIVFFVDEEFCTNDGFGKDFLNGIPSPEKLLFAEELQKYDILVKNKIDQMPLRCSYGPYSFRPKLRDFCGPQNIEKIIKVASVFGVNGKNIEVIGVPFHSNIIIDQKNISLEAETEKHQDLSIRLGSADSNDSKNQAKVTELDKNNLRYRPATIKNMPKAEISRRNAHKTGNGRTKNPQTSEMCNLL